MNRMTKWPRSLVLTLLFLSGFSLPVKSELVFTTLPGPVFEDGGSCFGGGDSVAVGFRTPNTGRYRMSEVNVYLQINQGEFETPFSLDLYDDESGFPGSKIVSIGGDFGTYVSNPTFMAFNITPNKLISLNPDTSYWVVIDSSDTSFCAFGWNDGGTDPATLNNVFAFAEEARSDGGDPWFYIDGFHQIEIYAEPIGATPAIVVKEFECPGFIPNPETDNGLPPVAPIFTTQTQGVAVVGKVGKISCHYDHAYPLTQAVYARDFVCTVPSPTTGEILVADKQLMLATPGGKALLQCQFGPSKGKPQPPQP